MRRPLLRTWPSFTSGTYNTTPSMPPSLSHTRPTPPPPRPVSFHPAPARLCAAANSPLHLLPPPPQMALLFSQVRLSPTPIITVTLAINAPADMRKFHSRAQATPAHDACACSGHVNRDVLPQLALAQRKPEPSTVTCCPMPRTQIISLARSVRNNNALSKSFYKNNNGNYMTAA